MYDQHKIHCVSTVTAAFLHEHLKGAAYCAVHTTDEIFCIKFCCQYGRHRTLAGTTVTTAFILLPWLL